MLNNNKIYSIRCKISRSMSFKLTNLDGNRVRFSIMKNYGIVKTLIILRLVNKTKTVKYMYNKGLIDKVSINLKC